MVTHAESRKEKLDNSYTLFGISADVSQLARSYIRGEAKGMSTNISQIISKLETIRKRI